MIYEIKQREKIYRAQRKKILDEINRRNKNFFYSRNKIIDELKERAKLKQYKPRTGKTFFIKGIK